MYPIIPPLIAKMHAADHASMLDAFVLADVKLSISVQKQKIRNSESIRSHAC